MSSDFSESLQSLRFKVDKLEKAVKDVLNVDVDKMYSVWITCSNCKSQRNFTFEYGKEVTKKDCPVCGVKGSI